MLLIRRQTPLRPTDENPETFSRELAISHNLCEDDIRCGDPHFDVVAGRIRCLVTVSNLIETCRRDDAGKCYSTVSLP